MDPNGTVIVAFLLQGRPLVLTDYDVDPDVGEPARFASLESAQAHVSRCETPGLRAADSIVAVDLATGETEVIL